MKKSTKFDSDIYVSVEDFLLFFIKKHLSLRVVQKSFAAASQGLTDVPASLFALLIAEKAFLLKRNAQIIW